MKRIMSRLFLRGTARPAGTPLEDTSREDQVAHMENLRGAADRSGARDQAKSVGPHPWAGNNGPGS